MTIAIIFVILVVLIHRALAHSSLFEGATAQLLACCVAILCILGLCRFLAGPPVRPDPPASATAVEQQHQKQDQRHSPNVYLLPLLLPYSALGATLLFSPLALLFFKRKGFGPKDWTFYKDGKPQKKHPFDSLTRIWQRRQRNEKAKIKSTRKDIHV